MPERFEKVYFHWIDNLRDWCISRQIWWGHRIPVWYRTDTDGKKETYVGVQPPTDTSEGWHEWEQDPDTLDTWFSSALWTWSTLDRPGSGRRITHFHSKTLLKQSPDFQAYHPTSVMETGWDILFFWVARMILATTYVTGQVPFKTVYLHGLVRTEDGKKMSKSHPETIIDPLEVIPEYGTDALRLALDQGMSAGNDQRLGGARSSPTVTSVISSGTSPAISKMSSVTMSAAHRLEPASAADHWMFRQLAEAQSRNQQRSG